MVLVEELIFYGLAFGADFLATLVLVPVSVRKLKPGNIS